MESFRPGAVDRLGVGYDAVRSRNPRIVYCSISAFGQDSVWRGRPAHDLALEAESGLVSMTLGSDGKPAMSGIPVADVPSTDGMWVLETNIDDLDPRVWPTVLAALLDAGAADAWLVQTARWTWSVKLAWQLESELFGVLRERAEAEAIRVFATNLHDLLLAAPAGNRVTMGLDPGLRTGLKLAVLDLSNMLM